MTSPAATPPAGTADLREAIAVVLCDCLRYDRERGIIIGIGDAADKLLAGPVATLRERIVEAERENDSLNAEHNDDLNHRLARECVLATLAAENEALRRALGDTICAIHNVDRRTAFHAGFTGAPAPNEMTDAYAAGVMARAALTSGGSDAAA